MGWPTPGQPDTSNKEDLTMTKLILSALIIALMTTIPEVRELLADAGFTRTDVYWEGADEDGEGTGQYSRLDSLQGDEGAWVSYIVAVK